MDTWTKKIYRGGNMIDGIKAHIQAIKAALAIRMAYRVDFLLSLLIMLLVEFSAPFITLLVYDNGASFPGWSLYEALLIQAVFMLSRGIAFPLFFGMVWNTLGRVREGTLDVLLLKPRSLLHMLIMTSFDSEDLGKLVGGLLLFTLSLSHLPFPGPLQWVEFFLVFMFSMIMLFAFALFMSGSAVIWVGNGRVFEIFSAITSFGQYPVSIFSKPVQTFATIVVPVSLLGSFPAAVLIGKPTPGIIAAIGSSILFLIISYLFWKRMMYRYSSAGG